MDPEAVAVTPARLTQGCFLVRDMNSEHCQGRVEAAVLSLDGVREARVDLEKGLLKTQGGEPEMILAAVRAAGYEIESVSEERENETRPSCQEQCRIPINPSSQGQDLGGAGGDDTACSQYMLDLPDISCGDCARRLEEVLRRVPGVRSAEVRLAEKKALLVGGDPQAALDALGAAACLAAAEEEAKSDKQVSSIEVKTTHHAVPEVRAAEGNPPDKTARVQGGTPGTMDKVISDQGYEAALRARALVAEVFYLKLRPRPLDDEIDQIQDILQARDPDVHLSVEVDRLRIVTTEHPADVLLRLTDIGYQVQLEEIHEDPVLRQRAETQREIGRSWRRAFVAAVAGFGIMIAHMGGFIPHLEGNRLFWASIALLCLVVMYYSGRHYYTDAFKQARHGVANMNTLVALGTSAAWVSSLLVIIWPDFIPGGGNYLYLDTSVLILAFLQFGHVLEVRAKRITSEAIDALLGLRVRNARVIRPAGTAEIPVSLLRPHDQVRVRPGEKVPIDGVIVEGRSMIDESMLTGEPLAVRRDLGDEVTGGTMNRSGGFVLKVTRLDKDTTLARIIRMVRKAQMSKPPIGRLVDRIAAVFVPMVILIALCTFFLWLGFGPEPRLAHALTTAIAVLMIACPCALGLATPIAIMVGTSRAAQLNILIRNSDALQNASGLTHIIMDKTGTLTEGRPRIYKILPAEGYNQAELLSLAAALESHSEHPLAEAVLNAYEEAGDGMPELDNFTAVAGRGVCAENQGQCCYLGNDHFLREHGLSLPRELVDASVQEAEQGGTPIWLAAGKSVLGLFILRDPLRQNSAAAVASLRRQGITVVMCTGDNRKTAEAVARILHIDEVHSEIMPEEKLRVVRQLQARGNKVGMLADGVNGAPALAQADTSFAIAGGADVTIENADITLNGASLLLLSTAVDISSATIRNIKQNLFGAFIYNVIGIPLAAGLCYPLTGWLLDPIFASAAMALSSVTVISNANRLRFFQPK